MPDSYRIADEPAPSALARYAVNPVFPFLSFMLGGLWIAWPWFAFNAYAVGSPTRRAEFAWLGLGLLAIFALVVSLLYLFGAGVLPEGALPYAGIPVLVAKIAVLYGVYALQARTIEIYEYYGGELQSGVWVLLLAFLLRGRIMDESMPLLVRWVLV